MSATFAECALARKPLRLVRRQAHLGDDDSRYVRPSILLLDDDDDDDDDGGDASEGGGGGGGGHGYGGGGRRPGGGASPSSPSPASALDDTPPPPPSRGARQRRSREAPLRHMSLFDLVAFGVGCTVGGGVFVLGGAAARTYAGPA